MTEVVPSRGPKARSPQGLRLISVPEQIELAALQGGMTTTRVVEVEDESLTLSVRGRAHSDTTSSSTLSITTSVFASFAVPSPKVAFVPGGGRRHHAPSKKKKTGDTGFTVSATPSQISLSLPASAAAPAVKPDKVYTPQQLRLLTAETSPGAFIPGGGRRHHVRRKKPATDSRGINPRRQANPLKGPSLAPTSSTWIQPPGVKPLLSGRSEPPKPTTTEMFGTPLSGISSGVPTTLYDYMSLEPHYLEPRNYVLQAAPTHFTVTPLAPHKYNTWHYGIRVKALKRFAHHHSDSPSSLASSTSSLSGGGRGSDAPNRSTFVGYDIWRSWEDILELQRFIEKEYTALALERRAFLTKQNHRHVYPSERAASFDSLPSGTDPLSTSLDVHTHLPTLSKKPKKLAANRTYSAGAGEDGAGAGKLKPKQRSLFFKSSALAGSSHAQALIAQARGEEFSTFLAALFQSEDVVIERVRDSARLRGWFGWWKRDKDGLERSMREGNPGAVAGVVAAGEHTHTMTMVSTASSSGTNKYSHPSDNGKGKGKERELLGMSAMANVSNDSGVPTPPHSTSTVSSFGEIPSNQTPATTTSVTSGTAIPSSSNSPPSPHGRDASPSQRQQQANPPPSRRPPSPPTLPSLTQRFLFKDAQTRQPNTKRPSSSGAPSLPVPPIALVPATTGAQGALSSPFAMPIVDPTPPQLPPHSHPAAHDGTALYVVPPPRRSPFSEPVKVRRPHTSPRHFPLTSPPSRPPPPPPRQRPSTSRSTSAPVNLSHSPPFPANIQPPSTTSLAAQTMEVGKTVRMPQQQRPLARVPSTSESTGARGMSQEYKSSNRASIASLNNALAETLGGFPMPPSSPSSGAEHTHGNISSSVSASSSPTTAYPHRASSPMSRTRAGSESIVGRPEESRGPVKFTLTRPNKDTGAGQANEPDTAPRHEGMGWGMAKSRSMVHLSSGSVTSQDNQTRPYSHEMPNPLLSVSTRSIPQPPLQQSLVHEVRGYAFGYNLNGVEDDTGQILGTRRRAHSESTRSQHSGHFATGTGVYDYGTHQKHRAEPPMTMLEASKEEEEEENGPGGVGVLSNGVDALPREMDDDEHLEAIRGLPEIFLGKLMNPLDSLDPIMQNPATSASPYEGGSVDALGVLRGHLRGYQNPEHRHARFFREEQARDDRFSRVLPDEDDDDLDDEAQEEEDGDTTSLTEAAILHGRLASVIETSLRPSSDSIGYADDGRSSIRFSEDDGSFTREFEMVPPLPPSYKTAKVTAYPVSQDDGEAQRPIDEDIFESSRAVGDSVDGHMKQLSISSVMTSAPSYPARHATLLPGKGGVYRSSSLMSYGRGVRPTKQIPSGSPSPPLTASGSPSKADKLQRRVSESSIRNAVRRLTKLDPFKSPRTRSPFVVARSGQDPSAEAIDNNGSGLRHATSEWPSDRRPIRSQTPPSFTPSSRDGSNGLREHSTRVSTEGSEGSVIDIRSNASLEGSTEQGGRHTPVSDALAHYFEGALGSDKGMSPSGSDRRSLPSGEHLSAHLPKRPSSSVSSLSSPLRTSTEDESAIHLLPESQRPASTIVASKNPVHRDSVTSIASPNQFPRPFQHRPAGQFHLPWIHTDTLHRRCTSSSFPPPSTPPPSTPVSSAFASSTLSSPSLAESFSAASGVTLVNPTSSQHVSTKVIHAPSGVAVILRLPRQISLHDLTEKVRAKFREVEDLDVSWEFPITPECHTLLLYYRKPLGNTPAPPSPHLSRNRIRSESVSSTSTGNDSLHQTFLRIKSGDELVHIIGSIPVGEKLVLRLVPAIWEGMTEPV